eukprot:358151-Chlamydomonas_euryale.AAC.3
MVYSLLQGGGWHTDCQDFVRTIHAGGWQRCAAVMDPQCQSKTNLPQLRGIPGSRGKKSRPLCQKRCRHASRPLEPEILQTAAR